MRFFLQQLFQRIQPPYGPLLQPRICALLCLPPVRAVVSGAVAGNQLTRSALNFVENFKNAVLWLEHSAGERAPAMAAATAAEEDPVDTDLKAVVATYRALYVD